MKNKNFIGATLDIIWWSCHCPHRRFTLLPRPEDKSLDLSLRDCCPLFWQQRSATVLCRNMLSHSSTKLVTIIQIHLIELFLQQQESNSGTMAMALFIVLHHHEKLSMTSVEWHYQRSDNFINIACALQFILVVLHGQVFLLDFDPKCNAATSTYTGKHGWYSNWPIVRHYTPNLELSINMLHVIAYYRITYALLPVRSNTSMSQY